MTGQYLKAFKHLIVFIQYIWYFIHIHKASISYMKLTIKTLIFSSIVLVEASKHKFPTYVDKIIKEVLWSLVLRT